MTPLALDFPDIDLAEEVRGLVHQVPEGRVTTYGHVAKALGDVVASRFVGKVMSENDDIVRVPCRRVVQSDGTLGGFTGGNGVPAKKKALQKEGIRIVGVRIVDFEKVLFKDFKTGYPLRRYRGVQKRDSKKLVLRDDYDESSPIVGTDIAYEGERAFGALVIFDRKTGRPGDIITASTETSFPYIPTYLTFREAPVIQKLISKAGIDPLLVHDGNGILHPIGFGVASHIGVLLDIPTIGVAKKLLCGTQSGQGKVRRITMGGRIVGFSVRQRENVKPVFISPGHRISQHSVMKVLRRYWRFRIPEPTRVAHIEAERFRRESR